MDQDILPVEADYEAQVSRVAELAAMGTVEPEVFIPVSSDMGGPQLEAAFMLDPDANFWEIDVGDVPQIVQRRSSFLDMMLREAEAAGFPYDRIHLGADHPDSQDWDSKEFDEQINAGLPVYNIVMDNADYFTKKLENGTFDAHALSQFLQATRDDPGLGEIFSTARKEELSGVFAAVHNNRIPLGNFQPQPVPTDLDPALLQTMMKFWSDFDKPEMGVTMRELQRYLSVPGSVKEGAVRGAAAPARIPYAVTKDLFIFRNFVRKNVLKLSFRVLDDNVRGWNHFFAKQGEAAILTAVNTADKTVRKTNELATRGVKQLGVESMDLLTHSLAAFGRLLVAKFEKK